MTGTIAAANAGGRIEKRAPMSSPTETVNQTAVSAATNTATPQQSVVSKAKSSGLTCVALYKPKKFQSIWWPALRFASIQDFKGALAGGSLQKLGSSKSLAWSSAKKEKKNTKRLVTKIMQEDLSGHSVEVICYLGRPLEEFVTADVAVQKGIEVMEWDNGGLDFLLAQKKDPNFAGLFRSECSESSYELFSDYFQGMDEIFARNVSGDSDSEDSDTDVSDCEENPSTPPKNAFSKLSQALWEAYQNRSHEESPQPMLQRQEEHEEEERSPQHQQQDEVSVAQSAAAVSYTEQSLMSASKGGAASVLTPPTLSENFIKPGDNFDTIWYQHQMEGWDGYLDESRNEMVFQAPNGYHFDTKQSFCEFLLETYGTCGEPIAKKSRGRARKPPSETNHRASSRSRSRSRSREHSGINFTTLWLYLKKEFKWTCQWANRSDTKLYGVDTSCLWFRPGFDTKNRGELGVDHFASEDSVLQYCQENNIQPPSRESKEEEQEPEEDEQDEEDDSSTEEIHADDPGYATPDDQSTVPQDPGKPRLPSPPGSASSEASRKSGGSYYSYDDPDRYVFQKLWARLKSKGWTWKKPRNSLDSYWFVKPASMRPQHEWKKGMDYFCSEEELIDFCRERDDLSRKEREKRRDERMLRLQRERESLEAPEIEETSEDTKETKKRSRSKKETKTQGKSKKSKQDKVSAREEKNLKVAATKRKTAVTAKKQRKGKKKVQKKKSKPEGWSCQDSYLKVDAGSSRQSPWVRNMPRYEHKLILNATGATWVNSTYFLPGETRENCTQRFEKVESVAQHFALNPQSIVWASGEKEPSNSDERDFQRSIRYALVPGLQSAWSEIRKITHSETSFLLRKLGYKNIRDTFWEPPEALVAMGHLEERYTSLESLCESLCYLSGDLHTPPSAASSRRRRQELLITPTQFMALRLRIAEGFSDSESDDELMDSDSESVAEEEERGYKKRKRERIQESDSEEEVEEEEEEQEYLTPPDEAGDESNTDEEHQVQLTPSEKKIKDFAEDEEQQLAMSPSRIKVGEYRKNPEANTAPWAMNPPSQPSIGWSRMYYKTGITFSNGSYFLPGESSKNFTKKFSKVDDIRDHINEEGNYSKYLDNLDAEDKKVVQRHLNYANVPGNQHDWRKLRELSKEETIIFLNLLGFEKEPRENGWWKIPEGVPILEQKSYPTLSQLCKALVRLPDLEDRTMGMGNRRRSRKKEEDMVLSNYQMMALRLRIAEGFEEDESEMVTDMLEERTDSDDESMQSEESEKQTEETKYTEESKPLFRYTSDLVEQLNYDTSSAGFQDAWKVLQDLGCSYSSGRYQLPGGYPGSVRSIDSSAGEMCQAILENSVGILDWQDYSLDDSEITYLVRYLKALNFRHIDFSLIEEALVRTTKANVRTYLKKLDVHEHDGKYQIEGEHCSESEIVNIIRRTSELSNMSRSTATPAKRRRSSSEEKLSKLESLSLRLWSVLVDIPLTNMPEKSTIGSAYRKAKEMQSSMNCESSDELEEDVAQLEQAANPESPAANEDSSEDKEPETADFLKEAGDNVQAPTIDQCAGMEESNGAIESSSENNYIRTPSVPVRTLAINETPAERTADVFETPREIDTEEVAGNIDSYSIEEIAESNPLPLDSTAIENASEIANIFNVKYQSPRKKRRKFRQEVDVLADVSSPHPEANQDFHTPKQHNMGGNGYGTLRTASSHDQASPADSKGILQTQDSFDMDQHAPLDFNMDVSLFSPDSHATKKLSPTQQTFGSRNRQSEGSVFLLTQQDEGNWLDAPIGEN